MPAPNRRRRNQSGRRLNATPYPAPISMPNLRRQTTIQWGCHTSGVATPVGIAVPVGVCGVNASTTLDAPVATLTQVHNERWG